MKNQSASYKLVIFSPVNIFVNCEQHVKLFFKQHLEIYQLFKNYSLSNAPFLSDTAPEAAPFPPLGAKGALQPLTGDQVCRGAIIM